MWYRFSSDMIIKHVECQIKAGLMKDRHQSAMSLETLRGMTWLSRRRNMVTHPSLISLSCPIDWSFISISLSWCNEWPHYRYTLRATEKREKDDRAAGTIHDSTNVLHTKLCLFSKLNSNLTQRNVCNHFIFCQCRFVASSFPQVWSTQQAHFGEWEIVVVGKCWSRPAP